MASERWRYPLLIAAAIACWSTAAMGTEGQPAPAAPAARWDFYPRLTLFELQYPQAVAFSAGTWLAAPSVGEQVTGVVAEGEIGLSGVTLALGPGTMNARRYGYEWATSFGVTGVVHRTWPWWSPWLPTSATFAGAEAFVRVLILRCSFGMLWPMESRIDASRTWIGGCGLGTP